MTELIIDQNLIDWDEIVHHDWETLLLGNGFSINIWEKFGYGKLYELAQSEEIDESLTDECIALFEHLGSSNFEDVLRVLYHSMLVDKQLGEPQKADIERLYKNTKNALAAAVNYAHIPPNQADINTINRKLRDYKHVFTTNYDLIPYWSIMEQVGYFKDYFWGRNNCFDISDTGADPENTKIYYLHGAIHLVELTNGKTQKLTANGLERLSDLFALNHPEKFPLVISEGSSEWKLSRIRMNDYLRFCYNNLEKVDGNLVILGHSLHRNYDQHIIDAINSSDANIIAISVWPGLSAEDIVSFKSRLLRDIDEKELYFYNSQTHPLGCVDLNISE